MNYNYKNCYLASNCKLRECKFKDENDICLRFFKIDYLLEKSLLSDKNKRDIELVLDVDGTDRVEYDELNNIKKHIKQFVNSGENLYICSSISGNGKTSWAIKLLKEYVLKVWPESELRCRVLFISVPKFLLELKSNISKKSEYIEYITENILSADLVVWDDIATKAATEFEHEHLLSLIDNRLFNNKSNIFTSNILTQNLSQLVGSRLASRINQSIIVEFKGKDKRGVKQG